VKFFEHVAELHSDAPRPSPSAIARRLPDADGGYAAAGLFGPCLVVGSPMSYWQGVRGKDPMRYSRACRVAAGSRPDQRPGRRTVRRVWLIMNFDGLNQPTRSGQAVRSLRQYRHGADRYLEFEKWWGDFIQLNGDELQFLVDKLFIGDLLARGGLHARMARPSTYG